MKGKFITFEGLDGCGKSTQLDRLATVLRGEGIQVITAREPGSTEIGERIRAILLNSATAGLAPVAELALMFAARGQLLEEIVRPALDAGKFVLCDRYTDSSEAYQGGGRKLGSEAVLAMHKAVCRGLNPDITILMDSDVSASVARARKRNRRVADGGSTDENRFEQESRAFYERVRNAYMEIAKRDSDRVFLVDARRSLEVVHKEIVEHVRSKLPAAASKNR